MLLGQLISTNDGLIDPSIPSMKLIVQAQYDLRTYRLQSLSAHYEYIHVSRTFVLLTQVRFH